jgi:lipoyl(octanoyl) transferase
MQPEIKGKLDYLPAYLAMQAFTLRREAQTQDELWLCEHSPVFTQGLAGKAAHVLVPGKVAVVATDRGGQVTYHGPGQVVAYPLLDLRRAGYFVKEYVYRLEEAVIRTLAHYGVTGHRVAGAPGVYVRLDDPFGHAALPARIQTTQAAAGPFEKLRADGAEVGKIAALGIKVSRHCTYHGLALNVAMDLKPFTRINPCGHAGLKVVDLSTIGVSTTWNEAARVLGEKLSALLLPSNP